MSFSLGLILQLVKLYSSIPDSWSSFKVLVCPSADVFTWEGDQITKKSLLKSPVETIDATETRNKFEEITNPAKKMSAVWKLFMVSVKEYVWGLDLILKILLYIGIDCMDDGCVTHVGTGDNGSIVKLRISLEGSKGIFSCHQKNLHSWEYLGLFIKEFTLNW